MTEEQMKDYPYPDSGTLPLTIVAYSDAAGVEGVMRGKMRTALENVPEGKRVVEILTKLDEFFEQEQKEVMDATSRIPRKQL
jgi:hypothetical protein